MLRECYAMSGTDVAYGAAIGGGSAYVVRRGLYGARRKGASELLLRYGFCEQHGASSLRTCYAMSGTDAA
eukprot:2558929-Rhodomonas_salina.2